jgi:hypothetical protein
VNNVVPYYDDIDFLCFQSHFRFTREVVEVVVVKAFLFNDFQYKYSGQ